MQLDAPNTSHEIRIALYKKHSWMLPIPAMRLELQCAKTKTGQPYSQLGPRRPWCCSLRYRRRRWRGWSGNRTLRWPRNHTRRWSRNHTLRWPRHHALRWRQRSAYRRGRHVVHDDAHTTFASLPLRIRGPSQRSRCRDLPLLDTRALPDTLPVMATIPFLWKIQPSPVDRCGVVQ